MSVSIEEPAGGGRDDASSSSEVLAGHTKELFDVAGTSKLIRVLTVLAYLLSVSFAAILLSVYYIFVWDPPARHYPGTGRLQDNRTDLDSYTMRAIDASGTQEPSHPAVNGSAEPPSKPAMLTTEPDAPPTAFASDTTAPEATASDTTAPDATASDTSTPDATASDATAAVTETTLDAHRADIETNSISKKTSHRKRRKEYPE